MRKTKKIMAIVLSLAMVAGISVAATLAYLTAQSTEDVANTFTVQTGVVKTPANDILVEESVVKEDPANPGSYIADPDEASTPSTTGNEYENVVPNGKIYKDPKIKVDHLTTNAYVFVRVTNGSSDIISDETVYGAVDKTQWNDITDTNGSGNVYVYKDVVAPVADTTSGGTTTVNWDMNVPFFSTTTLQLENFASVSENTGIKFHVYVCQSTGFDGAQAAWDACFKTPDPSTPGT